MDEVVIRARQAADLDECVAALRAVHSADGYPVNWPADPRQWLTRSALLQAWIAELPGLPVAGHVALQQAPTAATVEVTRLFVTPAARRRSVATLLLRQAAEWAADHDYQPTLNVVEEHRSAAVSFYESAGWHYTHTTTADWTTRGGEPVRLRHYKLTV